ncbi:MAG: UDP-N-acetylglucosamine 2-epimerase [Planctomycetia bacterium]|nr:UDP-N-acetylglucosamine 2-epimerase [Planctomycetia bacterium]
MPQVEPVSSDVTLSWMAEARAALKSAPWVDLLDFDGIDTFDVLLSPLYLAVLNTLRRGPVKPEPAAKAVLGQVRDVGYRLKTALRERSAAWRSAPVRPSDILLWSRDVTHYVNLVPVAEELDRLGISNCLLACQAKIFQGIKSRNPGAVYTLGAWPRVVRRARREGAKRVKQLAAAGPWKLPDFPGAPAAGVAPALRDTVIAFLPLVSETVANAQTALDAFRPKLLVVGNDITLEGRAGCRVAAARNVPTATFMHGNIAGNEFLAMHCADRLLVHGEIQRHELARQGVAPERMVVSGAPNLDHRPRQTGQIHPLLQKRLGIRPHDQWVLVATSGPGHRISHRHHGIVIEHLKRLSLAMPQVPVVVKLHRKDRLEYYRQALEDCGGARLVVVAEDAYGFPRDIFEWLQGCSVMLTGASTAAVDAMLTDVPVITMDFCDEIREADFIDFGATAHVTTPEALEAAVREVLAAGAPRAEVQSRVQMYLKAAFHALDGRSSSRGAEALREMISAR